MTNTWIITTNNNIQNLISIGRSLAGTITAVVVGDAKVFGVDQVVRIKPPADYPISAMAPAVCDAVNADAGDMVLAGNRPDERVLAGAVAASLNAPMLTGAVEVSEGNAILSRFGGISNEKVTFSSAAVAVMDGGAEADGELASEHAGSDACYNAQVTSIDQEKVAQVDLGGAKRIVSVGRGFRAQVDIELAQTLANAIGGEVACSRPIAEGAGWLPRDRYVGVSGVHVSPELYIAVGISGQIQHTSGMKDSKVVVAINSDEKAPIFEIADYGIVGDLYEVLPAITSAIK
jgi:Electron transfer flavoprotein, alpha subunit